MYETKYDYFFLSFVPSFWFKANLSQETEHEQICLLSMTMLQEKKNNNSLSLCHPFVRSTAK